MLFIFYIKMSCHYSKCWYKIVIEILVSGDRNSECEICLCLYKMGCWAKNCKFPWLTFLCNKICITILWINLLVVKLKMLQSIKQHNSCHRHSQLILDSIIILMIIMIAHKALTNTYLKVQINPLNSLILIILSIIYMLNSKTCSITL